MASIANPIPTQGVVSQLGKQVMAVLDFSAPLLSSPPARLPLSVGLTVPLGGKEKAVDVLDGMEHRCKGACEPDLLDFSQPKTA